MTSPDSDSSEEIQKAKVVTSEDGLKLGLGLLEGLVQPRLEGDLGLGDLLGGEGGAGVGRVDQVVGQPGRDVQLWFQICQIIFPLP